MYGSSGCLGGYVRPPPAALPEKVPQRKHRRWSKRRVRGQSAHSPQSWWMSSSNEMDDHSVLNSRSLQKLSKATNFCQDAGSHRNNTNNNNSNNSTFVNHALMSWNEQRRDWVAKKTKEQPQSQDLREPVIGWSTTYEELLGTSRPFSKPVPLTEMVDFLVDVWEQEGLYE